MRKRQWLLYPLCLLLPHVMLVVGLIFIASRDVQKKILGRRLCFVSTIALLVGSLIYYLFFTPIFGLD